MRKIIILATFFLMSWLTQAQYATQHHIAPAPWQYWSDANELVVSTVAEEDVTVSVFRSDGPLITSFTISAGQYATSYRFQGNPTTVNRNEVGNTYTNRGLIIEASAPVLVNVRNIASDITGTNVNNIKGNASLVSLGNEGQGQQFRLGYYRSSFGGLTTGQPIFTAMAVDNATTIMIDGVPLTTLNAGESRVFNAPIGALLEADKPIIVNVGNYGDTPVGCGGSGQDGTFIQVPPIDVLGSMYVVVRGDGESTTSADAPEQTTIVASEANTTVEVTHHTPDGDVIDTVVYTLDNAGDFQTFHHGDGENQFSSSFIVSTAPIVVYTGTAVECETDISVVLPIGGCSGVNDIRTMRFLDYDNDAIPYFCVIIIESETEQVFVNGENIETITGNTRVPIAGTGFYMITFEDSDVGVLEPIIIQSDAKLTTSIVQLGGGYSMSAYFSAFNEKSAPPQIEIDDCLLVLTAEEGMEPYQWYLNGEPIDGAINQTFIPEASGFYSVSGTQLCGETFPSDEVYVPFVVPIQLDLGGDQVFCEVPFQHFLVGTPENIKDIEAPISISWFRDGVLLPDTSSVLMVDQPGEYTVVVSYADVDCSESQTVNITAIENFEIDLGENIPVCDISTIVTLDATPDNASNLGDITYIWFFNGVEIPGEVQATIDVDQPGFYSVDVIAGVDCLETDTIEVFLVDFSVTIDENIIFPCSINELDIIPTIQGIDPSEATYVWSTGENTPTITITGTGQYWVEVTYLGCTETVQFNVTQAEYPQITIIDDIEKCPDDEVTLMVFVESPSDELIFSWFYNGQLIGDNSSEITVTEYGTYTVEVDLDGCVSNASVEVMPLSGNQNCIISQGISPDGSVGMNDNLNLTFLANRTGIEVLRVYNRYGTIVYERQNYVDEWRGQTNSGESLPTGLYYYHLVFSGVDQRYGSDTTGWIYVNRD